MADTDTWTIGKLLEWTTDYLKQSGSESPRLEAEVLLAHARDCRRIELYTCFEEVADESLRQAFRGLVKRRAEGVPVAYLVGYREFYSMDFEVGPNVLIPRPETEFVVIALLDCVKAAKQTEQPLRILDLGTGSGVLAICAAKNLPMASVLAVDISDDALAVAKRNAERHGVADRIEFRLSDMFARVDAQATFDYIVSNPPYIGERERDTLPRDVVDFEPHTALFSGPEGLDANRHLIEESPNFLKPGGWLLSELNPSQQLPLIEAAKQRGAFEAPAFTADLNQQPRVLMLRRRQDDKDVAP